MEMNDAEVGLYSHPCSTGLNCTSMLTFYPGIVENV